MAEQTALNIAGDWRKITGKSYNKKLRAKGYIPANLLEKGKAKSLEIDSKWLSKAWLNGKEFNLVMGDQTRKVKIHELQIDPVKRTAIHVDLVYC